MQVGNQLHAPCRFTFGETAPRAHLVGGWVGPRAGLAVMAKRKSCPYQELNPGLSARRPSLYWLSCPGSQSTSIRTEIKFVGFEVLTTVVMNNTVFWNTTAYSLVDRANVSEEPAASIFGIQPLVNIRPKDIFYSYHLASGHQILTSFFNLARIQWRLLISRLCDDKHCKTAV
jgi:hypothetical protein